MYNKFVEECAIHKIGEIEYIPIANGKELKKQVVQFAFVALTSPETQHPQPAYPEIQFIGGTTMYLTGMAEGDKVTVHFTMKSRANKQGKIFTNLVATALYKGFQMNGGE